MRLRSLLFVPGDRPERFARAAGCGADAVILDLEDSVTPARKAVARDAASAWLDDRADRAGPVRIVRINPLDADMLDIDLPVARRADAVMLPKVAGPADVLALVRAMGAQCPPILPIAMEVPAAIFTLGDYAAVADRLCGLTWGAEDLPAAIGAATSREPDGSYTPPYQLVRTLLLFGAHAAGVAAIETVYPAIHDADGLAAYALRGNRDGFTGMLAIHPAQVPVINAAFTPDADAVAQARTIVAAFAANPQAGALQQDGRMIDAPHLRQARAILERAGGFGSTTIP